MQCEEEEIKVRVYRWEREDIAVCILYICKLYNLGVKQEEKKGVIESCCGVMPLLFIQ